MTVKVGTFGPRETAKARVLGPYAGEYSPSCRIRVYREGNPKRQVTGSEVDLASVVSVTTSKNINQITGTFQVTIKDGRALYALHPMDVIVIELNGHTQPMGTVWRGLIETVTPSGMSDPEGGEESVVISGFCMGRYLQVNMFFLPVWKPASNLPTLLVYGLGGIYNHAATPREIIRAVYRTYVVGVGNEVGVSGTPAAQHWLDATSRVEKIKDAQGTVFRVPYVQFNEEPTEAVLTRLEITGFAEAWVDEVGHIVYRRPAWDQDVAWVLPAGELLDWEFPISGEGVATYAEVVPTGNPGLSTAAAEALLAGRAPVPSNYVASLKKTWKESDGTHQQFAPEFIIQVDGKGKATAKGQRNYYYRMMRRYGMRPLQIASPMLTTARQAQEQAQGLLRFFLRKSKTGKVTIPGEPQIRLGQNILVRGSLRGQRFERAFYVEGVSHEYVEERDGGHYQTTLELAHGRDPHDAHFPTLNLETLSPAEEAKLAEAFSKTGGEKGTQHQTAYQTGSEEAKTGSRGKAIVPGGAPEAVRHAVEGGNEIAGKTYLYGGMHGQPFAQLPAGAVFDCSSATSYILWKGGFLPSGYAETSGDLAVAYQEGAGRWITVYANASHAFIVVAGALFNTWNPVTGTDGLGWYPATASSVSAIEKSVGAMSKRHPKGY